MKTLTILLLLGLSFHVFGQNKTKGNNDAADQKSKIEGLENKVNQLQNTLDSIRSKMRDGNEAIEQAHKVYTAADEVYQLSKDSISSTDRILYGMGGVIVGIIALFFSISGVSIQTLKKRNEKRIEHLTLDARKGISTISKSAEMKIADLTRKNENIIRNMVNKHIKETELLKGNKILLINQKGTSIETSFEIVLKKFQDSPETVDSVDLADVDLDQLKSYDVVILDNNRINSDPETAIWNFSQPDLKQNLLKIVEATCSNNIAFLYFGDSENDGRFTKEVPQYNHLINFSNKPATLFANLIDLLDFRRMLQEKTTE